MVFQLEATPAAFATFKSRLFRRERVDSVREKHFFNLQIQTYTSNKQEHLEEPIASEHFAKEVFNASHRWINGWYC